LQGAVTWAFTFPGQPWFYGYRSLATHGVDKPVINIFRMLGMMERQRIAAESSGDLGIDALLKDSAQARPDIRAIATRNGSTIGILVWNYDDNSGSEPPAKVNLRISGLPENAGRVLITHYRIDNDHSNSCTLWKAMGSSQNPSADQIAKFKAAGQLQLLASPRWFTTRSGQVDLSFDLPRQAVSLVRIEWPSNVDWQADHK
jgi:xylan 1,4-beta-xylosidase